MTLLFSLVVSLLVILVMAAVLFLLMSANHNSRSAKLRQQADSLTLSYRPYASLSRQVREAQFQIIEIGQFRHFRHLLEGHFHPDDTTTKNPPCSVNLLDYSLVYEAGTANQTLLMLSCPLDNHLNGRFRIQPDNWLNADVFSEPITHNLVQLQHGQLHEEIRSLQIFSETPGTLASKLNHSVRQWLLAHPHLHIEWSHGILLLYRPNHLLAAEDLPAALASGYQLATRLQQ